MYVSFGGGEETIGALVGFAPLGRGASIFSSDDGGPSELSVIVSPPFLSFLPFHLSKLVPVGICFGIEDEDMK